MRKSNNALCIRFLVRTAENTVRQPPGSWGNGLPEFAGYFAPPVPPLIGPLKPGPTTAGQLPRTNTFATVGLIFGILSLTCCCPCPFNIFGLVFSLIGLSQINRHPELYEGRGLAIAGLILSAASLVLSFGLALLHSVLYPPYIWWHIKSF